MFCLVMHTCSISFVSLAACWITSRHIESHRHAPQLKWTTIIYFEDCYGCDGGEVSGIKLGFATMFRAKLSGITSSVFVNEMLPPG